MKLIREDITDVEYVTEERNGIKELYITGPFLQSAVPNRNRRFYPTHVLEREVTRYQKDYIDKNRAWGELGHPSGPGVNLDRISHMVKSLQKEGTDFIGKAQIIDTPMGNIARKLIEAGGTLGVSSRGLGSLKPDRKIGADVVQDDFHLAVAADIVADPSAPDAFVRGIMEGVEWVYDDTNGRWIQHKLEPMREAMKKMTTEKLKETGTELFEFFLQGLARPLHESHADGAMGATFKKCGFHYHSSTDHGNEVHHTYVGGSDPSINKLAKVVKREHGYRFHGQSHTTAELLNRDRTGGPVEHDSRWKHEDGSMVRHKSHTDGVQELTHIVKHVKEDVVLETDMTRLVYADRHGLKYTRVTEAWNRAKVLAESHDRGTDHGYIAAVMRRMLGIR